MKKAISLFIITLTIFFCQAQEFKALDEKNGFRDYKFGIPTEEISNLKLVEASKDSLTKVYSKTDDKKQIGEYDVENIYYSFYKNKLSFILLKTKGYLNSRGVLNVLVSLYGNGFQSNKYIEEYYWLGKVVTLSYKENSINNNATIIIQNNEIQNEKEADKSVKDKKATKDF